LSVAEIVAVAGTLIADELIVNLPLVIPAGTSMVNGTDAALRDELSFTMTAPFLGPGAALSVTVPAAVIPP